MFYDNPCQDGHVWIWATDGSLTTGPPSEEYLCRCGKIKWKDRIMEEVLKDRKRAWDKLAEM